MANFLKDVQDSPRTGLGIPVKARNLLFRTILLFAEHPFGSKPGGRGGGGSAPARRAYKFLFSSARQPGPPGMHNRRCRTHYDFYWPSPLLLHRIGFFDSMYTKYSSINIT